jgi:hypothetical protein
MTKAAHTPGPWKVDVFTTAILLESKEGCICEMPSDHGQHAGRRVANARLIAAAPELLEVLEGILPEYESYVMSEQDEEIRDRNSAWLEHARATLAKAKGGAA